MISQMARATEGCALHSNDVFLQQRPPQRPASQAIAPGALDPLGRTLHRKLRQTAPTWPAVLKIRERWD
jgi:hypothetical protein